MNRICCVYLLCVLSFCGVCFADDTFTVNVAAYGTANSGTVAVDVNNSPVVATSHLPGYDGLSIITKTPAGYEANGVPDTNGGAWPRLKITSNSELSLVYRKSLSDAAPSYGLWYGIKGSWFDWIFSMIEGPPTSSSVSRADMDLTANDIPHIVYYLSGGSQGSGIFHTFFDVHSQQWIKEKLDGFGSGGGFSNLSIDIAPDGKIMISGSADDVKVAVYSDGFWSYLPPLMAYERISSSSFTADSLPAVAFERSGQIIYAVYINDVIGWAETVVAPVVTPISQYSIALAHSSTNVPGIVYVDNQSLMYASNVAGGWTTTMIDEQVAVDAKPNLIFDHNDKPLMVYNSYDECADMPTLNIAGIGLESFNIADLNRDKIVNFFDFMVLADYWMAQSTPPDFLTGDLNKDGFVNNEDLKWLSCYWLWQGSAE